MKAKDLSVEWLDLVRDETDPRRCHLIKSATGEVINSGTRYAGEDGKVHIKWDKPRERVSWQVDRTLTADDLKKYRNAGE